MRHHAVIATALAGAALLAAGCGEKDEPRAELTAATSTTSTNPATEAAAKPGSGENGGEAGDSNPGPTPAEVAAKRRREAERVVREYIEALDERDGAAVCGLLAPGALDGVKLPHDRGSCAASLNASIGFKDPRGLPQFAGVAVAQMGSTDVGAKQARVTTTIVTRFADRTEPSIEDDIIYLTRVGDELLVAKASTALYRAVGIADIPPEVISPPQG